MEGCQPNFVNFSGALGSEEVLTFVEPAEGVIFSIVGGERKFVVAWNAETVVISRRRFMGKLRRKLWNGGWEAG
jgi:hypothetical protein